ncbi:MAG: insulinase family protein, partial [Acidimicrobiia bacterium]|nr:insulinase family protein [Acidimicrobiia bacterium]
TVLRRLGVEIGPDLNAFTSFDETVYQLGMPSVRSDDLELGLRVLAQWAGSATIDQSEVEAERGVVREEFRVRSETGSAAINERLFEIYSADSGYEGHLPIGSDDKILATNADELREFYDDWYRPDNMAVVAVGDFDVDEIERLIKQELSGVSDRGSSPERLPVEADPLTEPIIEVVTRDGGPEPSISLDYQLPNWDPSTVGGQRMLLADNLLGSMLTIYLDELAADGTLDIVRPFVEPFEFTRSRRFLGMNVAATDYTQGATDLMRAMRTAQERGFTPDHLDQARQQFQSFVAQRVASHDTTQDRELAGELVAHVLTGQPLENIDDWERRMTEQLRSFELDELNRLFKAEMARSAPLFTLLGSDSSVLPTQAELEAAVQAGMNGDLIDQRAAVAIDQLVARPDGPDPVEQDEIWGLTDDRYWLFDNGASVLFWDSDIAANQVDVWLFSVAGRDGLTERQSRLASMAITAVTHSGVAGFDQVSLDRYLASTPIRLSAFVDLRLQGMTGSAAGKDLPVLFELINAYYTGAQINDAGLAVAANEMEATLRAIETEPGFASFVAEREARFINHPNLVGLPDAATMADAVAASGSAGGSPRLAAELLEIFESRFSSPNDLVVIVVGDVDANSVLDLASDYVGSLPEGVSDPVAEVASYPVGPIAIEIDAGLNDSGAGFDRYYHNAGVLTEAESVHADLLSVIINDRLFVRVREEMGASYGGGRAAVVTGPLNSFDTSFSISVNGDPARLAEIMATVDEELEVLLSAGPSADDLAEAKAVLINDVQLINNFTLMTFLLDFHSTGEPGDLLAEEVLIEQASAADIRRVANKLLDPANLIEVTRRPGG